MNEKPLITRLLAVEVLLTDPAALGNDALEGDLYILRDQLRDQVRTVCQSPASPAESNPAE
jgi:hypothetical protein